MATKGEQADEPTDALAVGSGAAPAASSVSFPRLSADVGPLGVLGRGALVGERFVVDHLAAVGGMSVVYRAADQTTGQLVALKVLNKRDPITDGRFATEAKTLAALSHPSIVGYIAHGVTAQNALFLAMEWLSGRDLSSQLREHGLRASEALTLMRQLCTGLGVAHSLGVLHRDIKPSNLFLVGGRVDCVKILDFGIARRHVMTTLRTRTGRERDTTQLTSAGTLVGTVGYMSPEQARGALDLDARCDVFGLGCVLYECLTGQPAFSGAHDLAVLAKVLRDEPPQVSSLRPDLGYEFDGLMALLLAKDRRQRPSTAEAALGAIEETYARSVFDEDAAAPVARGRASYGEQRILSVIVGRPRVDASRLRSRTQERASTAPAPVVHADTSWVEPLSRAFDAEVIPMRGGALLVVLTAGAHSTATDQAARAARCVLQLAQLRADLSLGLATGAVDTTSHVPVGVAIDRAVALLDDDVEGVHVDALTASLLGSRFDIQHTPLGLRLDSEREETDTNVLMGRSTPFVGRAKELAILGAGLRESCEDGCSRGIVVTGPAGAGKSRLGREFVERARLEKSTQVLFARADQTTAGSSLSLVQSLLRNAAALRSGESADAQRAALATYLSSATGQPDDSLLFDFLGEIVGIAESAPTRPLHRAARGDPEVMREQKRRAFERWMALVVERGPVLLFLEDVHWADLPSLSFVLASMRSLADRSLFVLATARPELYAQFPKLREHGELEEVILRGLTRRASEQLARTILPSTTPAAIIDRVVALASGNAFYLEELVRRVAEGGGAELPETVVAMAQSRIERLPAEARRLLRAASVYGETSWRGGIDSLLATSEDSTTLLSWLSEQEILQRTAASRYPGESEYTFRHALLREACYAMLTDADRRSAHLRAGEWLEARGERDARVLADHFERGGAIARAVPLIARASMAALDSGDFESAIGLSRRGTSLGAYGPQRGMLLLVRAYASTWKCEPELPDEALSLLPRASAPWWLALSVHVFSCSLLGTPQLAEPYLHLALTTSPDTELSSAYGQSIQVLAAGAALLGQANIGWALVKHFEHASTSQAPSSAPREARADPAFLAWFNLSKCVLATNSLMDGQTWALGRALVWGRDSIEAMRVLGSGSGEAAALFHLGNAYWLAGDFARSLTLLQRARELAKRTGNLLVEEHADLLLAVAALRDGSRAAALAMLANLASSANLLLSHAAATVLADTYLRAGHLTEAIERAQQAARGSSLMYRRAARGTLARAHLAQAGYREALAATDMAFADGSPEAFPHLTVDLLNSRASALLGCGLYAEAVYTVERASRFRAAVADGIDEPACRDAFRTRGRANRILDHLSSQLLPG